MKIDDAVSAGQLGAKVFALTKLVSDLDIAIKEGWAVASLTLAAPSEGASVPAGTAVNIVPPQAVSDKLSQIALGAARSGYQQELDALAAQLAAL